MIKRVPPDWMTKASMQRVIFHWTAGGHRASDNDRAHYHVLVEADGKVVKGIPSISGNSSTNPFGVRASHTLNCNTGSIGVSMCCMLNAQERPFVSGKYPMTRAQWETTAEVIAELCEHYNIRVSPKTVLSHAEVQSNLNIRQRGKWDVARLSFDETFVGAAACGDEMRRMVLALMPAPKKTIVKEK